MAASAKGVKFTLQDHNGIRSVDALEALAGVIQALIDSRGREHAADLLDLAADGIRAGEIGPHLDPDQPTCH